MAWVWVWVRVAAVGTPRGGTYRPSGRECRGRQNGRNGETWRKRVQTAIKVQLQTRVPAAAAAAVSHESHRVSHRTQHIHPTYHTHTHTHISLPILTRPPSFCLSLVPSFSFHARFFSDLRFDSTRLDSTRHESEWLRWTVIRVSQRRIDCREKPATSDTTTTPMEREMPIHAGEYVY